jgi:hypothetical protein
LAATAGWSGEVQMPGAAAAGAAAGVLTGLGVLAGALGRAGALDGAGVRGEAGALDGAGALAGGWAPAGAGSRAGTGTTAEPEMSRAESARAYQGHRPRCRIVITLLRQRKTLGSKAGATMSLACENCEGFAGRVRRGHWGAS